MTPRPDAWDRAYARKKAARKRIEAEVAARRADLALRTDGEHIKTLTDADLLHLAEVVVKGEQDEAESA